MDIQDKLYELGLSRSEIKVYLHLLEFGILTPPRIASGTGIARPNCYEILRKLASKGLIEEHAKGKRKTYAVKDPLALAQFEEMRLQKIKQVVPELRLLYETKKNKPKIQFLDGFNQVKSIWTMSLEARHIRGITSTKSLYQNSPSFFNDYHKKICKRGILLQDILTADSAGEATEWTIQSIGPMYETRFLPKKYLTLPTDILVWNDYVALMHITEPVAATVIQQQEMADTFRVLFDLSWKQLGN